MEAGIEHLERTGRCLLCDIVSEELERASVIWQDERFVVYVPFFARYPYEVHLARLKAHPRLAWPRWIGGEQTSLAKGIKEVATAYDNLFGFPLPYMMVMHQRPTDGKEHPEAHFRRRILSPQPHGRQAQSILQDARAGQGTFITDIAPETQAEKTPRDASKRGESAPKRSRRGVIYFPRNIVRGDKWMVQEKTAGKVARCLEAFRRLIDGKVNEGELVAARVQLRVNLIGEHTDDNDGFVFPMAIDREVVLVGRARNDRGPSASTRWITAGKHI